MAQVRNVAKDERFTLAGLELLECVAEHARTAASRECIARFTFRRYDFEQLPTATARLEHVSAHVSRDPAEPCLDRTFGAVRRHSAMSAEERFLYRLVGVGLRPEERHTKASEDRMVAASTRGKCVPVTTRVDHLHDRITSTLRHGCH